MYKDINPINQDSMMLKHTIIANFGFLLANTIDKNFNQKLNINMRNLTCYLIESKLINAAELKQIIKSQSNFGITEHYHFTKLFKGDELTEPSLLFQITKIIMNLGNFLFKNSKLNDFLKSDTFLRRNFYNNPVKEIYTSYFNIVKYSIQNCDLIMRHTSISTIQNNLIEAIDFHYHPSGKSIFYYEEHEKDSKIRILKENKVKLLEELCEIIQTHNLNPNDETINNIINVLFNNLSEFKDLRGKNLILASYYDLFEKHLNNDLEKRK